MDPLRPPPHTHINPTAASSCAGLDTALVSVATYMGTVVKGKHAFVIELSCGAGDKYDDCPAASIMPKWFGPKPGPFLDLTIRAAASCTGASRPVLSGDSSTFEPLIMSLEKNLHLKLQNIILDGKEQRPGIYAGPAASLTLLNVDVINTRNNYEEAPGLWATDTAVKITGGKVRGCVLPGC